MKEHNLSTIEKKASPAQNDEIIVRTFELTRQYGTRVAVDRINLEIKRGEIVGFLGPNGAGKTTTIRMILGLIKPTTGRVELFGRELATGWSQLLPRVGALVEMPALYLHLTGRENLRAFGSVLGGVSQQRIDAVLELVGLDMRQKDRVRTYSLGMKQRLGLAVALLNDPELLILDEPANGLDPAGIVEMRELMHRLVKEGKTIVFSSHLLGEVQQICTRVVVINVGKLVADKPIEELTHGQGEYNVRLEHIQEALSLLQQQPWGKKAHIDASGILVTPAPQNSGRELSAFLSQAGFPPDSLTPATQNLEQVFFSLINSQKEGE